MRVSIILTAYIQTKFQCHMTMACIANITKFTDPDQYELIVMSDSEKYPIRDDYKVLKIDKYIKTQGESYTQAMNHGAREATGDILVFLQNDVFVHDYWLDKLQQYIVGGHFEAVFPDQAPRSRKYVKDTYARPPFDPESLKGSRDAGCLMITKEAFERTGDWNEDLTLLCEADFYQRMGKAKVRWTDTNKCMITHIMAATNLDRLETKPEEYESMMKHDADILNK